MSAFRKACLALAGLTVLPLLLGVADGNAALWQPAAVVASVAFALGSAGIPALRGYQFTAWILAAVVCAMIRPAAFLHWGGIDLRNKWLILAVVQTVMFGMGTQM